MLMKSEPLWICVCVPEGGMEEPRPIDFARVAGELNLSTDQVVNVTRLLDAGNTVPFITRYRKEQSGNLDEVAIRKIHERVDNLRQLADRAETIERLIEAQGKLTPKLREAIASATSLKRLEDLYLPFRPKRKSRASSARERGLEPLAESIWNATADKNLEVAAAPYVNAEREVPTAADALQGASDILAEQISEDAAVRERCREIAVKSGRLAVSAAKPDDPEHHDYRDYFQYQEAVGRIPPHRVLALNRGESAGALKVRFEWDEEAARSDVARQLEFGIHPHREFLERCAADSLGRLILPSLEREIRKDLTSRAEAHAVTVFAHNLRNLLLQPPLGGQRILAIDPGFRTGCKVAVLDECGHCLETDVVYVTGSAEKRAAGKEKIAALLKQHGSQIIAIGNGTACREVEELISEAIAELKLDASYVIVNEAGASIYSTSTVAAEEFPQYDATVRGTISIGRRLQDPLSELVKIEPQHIGVGMYQHDISPKLLQESLSDVVESCVNYVGVDLNTASASLLRSVSGLNQLIARRVVAWREEHGAFRSRQQLLEVPGIGEATFTQAAGFLKIRDGEKPLDGTWIHPESYEVAERILKRLSIDRDKLLGSRGDAEFQQQLAAVDVDELASDLKIGKPTCRDILDALARPDRDPRCDSPGPIFRQGVLKLDDLAEGMELTGRVLNVVDFGVFVDIGLKDSGLVHVSQMSTRFVSSPQEIASVGDIVKVWVIKIDLERKRVSLTMIPPGTTRETPQTRRPAEKSADRPDQENVTASQKPAERPRQPARRDSRQATSPPKSKRPAKPLSSEMLDGREPLRGFDQLKDLWNKRDRK